MEVIFSRARNASRPKSMFSEQIMRKSWFRMIGENFTNSFSFAFTRPAIDSYILLVSYRNMRNDPNFTLDITEEGMKIEVIIKNRKEG